MTAAAVRAALAHLAAADPVLADIIRRVGPFALQYREPDFETLVRSIVYQQISGKAALSIFGRLQAACADGGRMTPAAVLGLDAAAMRRVGLSAQKARYVRDLAEKTAAGAVDFPALPALADDAVIAQLVQVKGVGVWTAQMFLIFALRRPDVLPASDLGIRAAVTRAYRLRKPATPARVQQVGRPWRPYASVASWYLWRSLLNFAAL
ncbi:MAG: DNA-3-methyladenine glycosylase 2 family protein [Acidobacteria bacterium]|nr:MAG: DNA-3-methyladenine glycosylase 2 family protein [Acidobacteriota bacterium]